MGKIEPYAMLMDGKWCPASDGATFESFNPATGEVWSTVPEATGQDVNDAVEAAHRALNGPWGEMVPTQRGKCLRRLGDLLAENSEALGRAETTDTGRMFKETAWQATHIAGFLHFYAGSMPAPPTISMATPCRSTSRTCLSSPTANLWA